jgi:hypothetical protein
VQERETGCLIIQFPFAFLASEAVAHFELKVSFYASSR